MTCGKLYVIRDKKIHLTVAVEVRGKVMSS